MENTPLALESVVARLQEQALEFKESVIVQARIAISPTETRLLAIQPEGLLEIIHY
jgi:hypothetical protein